MIGVIQKIGLGLAASVCLGAIVACQTTSPTAAPPDPAPESEATEPAETEDQDRKSVVQGKSVDLGGRRIIKKKR